MLASVCLGRGGLKLRLWGKCGEWWELQEIRDSGVVEFGGKSGRGEQKVEESLNVTFEETPPPSKTSPLVDDDLDEEEAIKGACVFSDKWSLDELAYGVPTDGPYQTNPLSPNDIISSIQINQEGQVTCIRHEEEIEVYDHQILTRDSVPTLKPLEEIIQENVFCLGTRKDHGMRRGRHSASSSYAFDQPSSPHLNDDDDGNDEGTSRASTLSPIHFVNSLTNEVPQKIKLTIIHPKQLFVDLTNDDDKLTTPSPTTTSLSPTPPNAPSKTPSINQTSSSQENTSSSFQSKHKISPPSSNEPTSHQPLNPLLKNISDVPPRSLNPQPLQSHLSLDVTLSLLPITPLDHIHDTPSPLSLPQP
uniref:Pentatricopeptide repeat-containing protein n=1 Tax=Tanacetum cinerariifolium TaxID=118510 RepID=A0A699H007_TANCI|nr:pentatricopeptide repeat-containing protein [Tanacetum cinerariifolium]